MYLHAFENNFINSASVTEVTIVFWQIKLNNNWDSIIAFFDNPEIICGNFGSSVTDFPWTTLSGQ